MQNVIASFREVGVYPTNRDRAISKFFADTQSPQEHPSTTIPYVPFCTPRSQPVEVVPKTPQCTPLHSQQGRITPNENDTSVLLVTSPPPLPFTKAKVQKFQKRLEEGYDMPDARYSQWLSTLTATYRQSDSILDKIVRPPISPTQKKLGEYARGARVLTSEQCRQELFQKEQEKRSQPKRRQQNWGTRRERRQRKQRSNEERRLKKRKRKKDGKQESSRKTKRNNNKRKKRGLHWQHKAGKKVHIFAAKYDFCTCYIYISNI